MSSKIFEAKTLEELAEILGPAPCGLLAVGSSYFYNGPTVPEDSNELFFHWQYTGLPPFQEDDPLWCFLNEIEMGLIYKSEDGLFWIISIMNGDDHWKHIRPVKIGRKKKRSLRWAQKKFEGIVLRNLEKLGFVWEE